MNPAINRALQWSLCCLIVVCGSLAAADESLSAKAKNEDAVQEVLSGKQTKANAAWWGFDTEDSTDALQSAIDSGAKTVIVPYMGDPWIVRPITLRSNQEILFEPGVLVLAKKGEFKGGGDSLFRATDQTDITLRGYGATLRMRKKDYQSDAYQRAEWRMGLAFVGCKRIRVEGLRCESSGGDGIYIGSSGKNRWCEDVVVRDVVCYDNHRQGISVISAVNLLIENCILANTSGTPPEAGIDLEPDSPDEKLVNCVIRNCVMENNQGHAILVYLKPMTRQSDPVSILFENCHSRMGNTAGLPVEDFKDPELRGWSGMAVGAVKDDGPQGLIEFKNCTAENTGKEGAKIFDKSANSATVRFVNCSWKSPWVSRHRQDGGPRVPVLIHLRRPDLTQKIGGIEFVDCTVYDDGYRPALWVEEDKSDFGVYNLSGCITVHNPSGARMKLGPRPKNTDLRIIDAGQ
ncbi:MAG: right-handed parallel beta-helix repeat-containing protein [bacterium]